MPRTRPSLLTELNAHYRGQCYLVPGSHSRIERRLKDLMGRERYARYLATAERVHAGAAPISELYATVATLEEASALMSHQAREAVAAAAALHVVAYPYIRPLARVADLGCFTGTLTSFLATRHPETAFVGFDRLDRLLRLAGDRDTALGNLSYVTWDYAEPPSAAVAPFDVLLSSFGVDFRSGLRRFSLDPASTRSGAEYVETRRFIAPLLANWRSLAAAGGRCFVVLRLPHVESLAGVVDAAASGGWRWTPGESRHVEVGAETFTLLAWEAVSGAAAPPTESALLEFDARLPASALPDLLRAQGVRDLQGSAAMLAFDAMAPTVVTATSTRRFDDGLAMRKRLGTFKHGHYIYTTAETGYRNLVLGGESDRKELETRYDLEFWTGAYPE